MSVFARIPLFRSSFSCVSRKKCLWLSCTFRLFSGVDLHKIRKIRVTIESDTCVCWVQLEFSCFVYANGSLQTAPVLFVDKFYL